MLAGCRGGERLEGAGAIGDVGIFRLARWGRRRRVRGVLDQTAQRIEDALTLAATHLALSDFKLLGRNAERGATVGTAGEHHDLPPSRRTQPSNVAPTSSATCGA